MDKRDDLLKHLNKRTISKVKAKREVVIMMFNDGSELVIGVKKDNLCDKTTFRQTLFFRDMVKK